MYCKFNRNVFEYNSYYKYNILQNILGILGEIYNLKTIKLKDKITKLLIFFLSIVILVCSSLLIKDLKEEKNKKSVFEELAKISNIESSKENDIETEVNPDLQKLFEKNNDIVGWIKIDGTTINYPVMQKDNDYYLYRDFDKNYSKYGTPFAADYCDINLDDNIIIYGHHMKNGMMFADLEKYKNKEFYEKNKYIDLFILDKEKTLKRKYEIISVFKILATDEEFKYYEYHNLDEFTAYQDYVNKVKEKSLYEIGNIAEYPEKLITLSTCEYSREDGRLVVVAKKVK